MERLTDFLRPGTIYFRKKEYDPQTVMAGIESVARRLHDTLVSDSPFVYLFAINHIKTVFSYFGIIKAGRICVIMDPKIGPLELAEKLQDTPPAACIRINRATETFDFDKEIEVRDPPWKDDGEEDLSDVCTMIYTAAEDGYAKAVMLTHANMLANARAVAEGNNVDEKSATCALLPYSHSFGIQVGAITPVLAGGKVIIEEEYDLVKSNNFIENALNYSMTHFYSIPVVYYLLSKKKDIKKIFNSVYSTISGGYALTDEIRQKMFDKHSVKILQGYGLSETSPVCTWNFPEENNKPESVGRAIACCMAKAIGEDGIEMPFGKEAEICIKGTNIMKGYYKQKEATKKTLINGWFHTGDLGYMDNDGFVFLTGLKKRMINYSGKKVYPAEVERLILSNHKNVLSVKVFGEKSRLLGQGVRAKIRLKDNFLQAQNELMAWCRRSITEYKIPSKFEFN